MQLSPDLIAIFTVGILVAWRIIGLSTLLYPVKMLAVAYHEFWHIMIGVCLGQKLEKVDLDPGLGGKTVFNAPEAPQISLQPVACYFVSLTSLFGLLGIQSMCLFNAVTTGRNDRKCPHWLAARPLRIQHSSQQNRKFLHRSELCGYLMVC